MARELPTGSDGSTGSAAAGEVWCVRCAWGVVAGVLGVADGVAVERGGVGAGGGAEDCTGGAGTWVVGDTGGFSTVIDPWPVRMPSVAVTPADFVAVNVLDADAGVLAGSRSENDEPETLIDTVTSVRFANDTHPPW